MSEKISLDSSEMRYKNIVLLHLLKQVKLQKIFNFQDYSVFSLFESRRSDG